MAPEASVLFSQRLVWVPLLHPNLEDLQTESARPLCRQPKCFFPVHPGSASLRILLVVLGRIPLASDLGLFAHLNNKAVAHHVREDPCSLLKRRSLGSRWLTTLFSRPILKTLQPHANPVQNSERTYLKDSLCLVTQWPKYVRYLCNPRSAASWINSSKQNIQELFGCSTKREKVRNICRQLSTATCQRDRIWMAKGPRTGAQLVTCPYKHFTFI